MKVSPLPLAGPLLLEPDIHSDERGYLSETFRRSAFEAAVGRSVDFVQDNHSHSIGGVLRGLHYQLEPRAQAKLVRVVSGEIFDVAVDIRRGSPDFRRWIGVVLSAENRRQLWIPEGFAHGFVVLSARADVIYKMSDYHSPEHGRSIRWDDPALAIEWPLQDAPALSPKDAAAPRLAEADLFG